MVYFVLNQIFGENTEGGVDLRFWISDLRFHCTVLTIRKVDLRFWISDLRFHYMVLNLRFHCTVLTIRKSEI